MPVYNKPIIQTSGNLSGNGRADSPVVLKDAVSLMSVTASFSGDGTNLINILPSISESHVVYVSSHATNVGADGTLKKPFQTVSAALTYIGTQISADDPVLVNLLPGTYDPFTVTRHDTYFKSDFGRDRQRAATVNGPIVVATDGAQKYNDIIGFEGIFFNTTGVNSVPVVEISGSGKGLTYFDDCYIASNGIAECLKLNNTLTFADNKLVLRNTTFLGQIMGPDLLSINGGDAELDSCKFYYSTGTVSTGSAISVTGDSYVVADRCLIDIQTNDYVIDLQPSRISGSVFTNSAIGSTGASSPGLVYTTKPLTLWNMLFTGNTSLLTGSSPFAQIFYSSLTSVIPVTTSGVTMNPLSETHGTVIASALSGNLSSSYLVGAVPVSKGGTGATTFNSGSYLVGDTANSIKTKTASQVTADLDLFSTSSTIKGLVVGSNGSNNNYFLRADGTWASKPYGQFVISGSQIYSSAGAIINNFSQDLSSSISVSAGSFTFSETGRYLISITGRLAVTAVSGDTPTALKIETRYGGDVLDAIYASSEVNAVAADRSYIVSRTQLVDVNTIGKQIDFYATVLSGTSITGSWQNVGGPDGNFGHNLKVVMTKI